MSRLLGHPAPCYLNCNKLYLTLGDQYHILSTVNIEGTIPQYHINTFFEWDSNLGPNSLSLLEFETWQIRPLGHQGRYYISTLFARKQLGENIENVLTIQHKGIVNIFDLSNVDKYKVICSAKKGWETLYDRSHGNNSVRSVLHLTSF